MNIVLLQTHLSEEDIDLLIKEFPQYLFLPVTPNSCKNLQDDDWARVEVLFGSQLNEEQGKKAHQLRWIHTPTPSTGRLNLSYLLEKDHLLITTTAEENITQIGEFVLSAILAFAKNLFHWQNLKHTPELVWDSKWRESMWSLKKRTLLQIGLDPRGTEIARKCQEMGMHVIGALPHKTLHPYCHETVSFEEAPLVLSKADIVCLCLPENKLWVNFFDADDFSLMKKDTIFIVLGMHTVVDEKAFAEYSASGKLRGALFDSSYLTPPPPRSLLWKLPNVIITPEIAPRPKNDDTQSFHTFLYNLRQYSHGNFKDMRSLLEIKHSSHTLN
jgi:phosphoglycerate dehydrogenase-like enzyme